MLPDVEAPPRTHPEGRGDPCAAFTVDLPAGSYQVEWFDVTNRETTMSEALTVKSASTVEFSSPFPPGPAVLYLSRT